jgi:hypothetical protein
MKKDWEKNYWEMRMPRNERSGGVLGGILCTILWEMRFLVLWATVYFIRNGILSRLMQHKKQTIITIIRIFLGLTAYLVTDITAIHVIDHAQFRINCNTNRSNDDSQLSSFCLANSQLKQSQAIKRRENVTWLEC